MPFSIIQVVFMLTERCLYPVPWPAFYNVNNCKIWFTVVLIKHTFVAHAIGILCLHLMNLSVINMRPYNKLATKNVSITQHMHQLCHQMNTLPKMFSTLLICHEAGLTIAPTLHNIPC